MSKTPDPTRLTEDQQRHTYQMVYALSCRACAEKDRQRADLQAENARLTAALRKLGAHTMSCMGNYGEDCECSCGLRAALTPKGETP